MNRRSFCSGALGLAALDPVLTARVSRDPHSDWDAAGQAKRRGEIYALHQASVGPLFDEDGTWVGKSTPPIGRERLWNSLSLLKSPATRAKANAIITSSFRDRAKYPEFSHFEYVGAAQLLIRDDGELTAESKSLLSGLLHEALDRKTEMYFMGYNDNFPAMENEVACIGGDLLNDSAAQKRGLEGLHRILELLDRRGLLSEYTSSTYSPVTVLCYSDIAQYSKDPSVRALALEVERRVWTDLASHFHGPTNILAGPHSRAYMVDTVGHMHQLQMIAYQAFGQKLWMNPTRFLFPPAPRQVIHHDGDVPFMQASAVWMASGTYHPTFEIEKTFFNKPLPYKVSATSEFGSARELVAVRSTQPNVKPTPTSETFEYPAGELVSTSYLTHDYSIGSATAPFIDGNQTDTFFVTFRRAAKPNSLEDVSTVFCRYTTDNFAPGQPWTDPRNPGQEVTKSLLGEAGRTRTVQKGRTAVVVYQSKGQFVGDYTGLRLTIVVPTIYRSLRAIWVADRQVSLPYKSDTLEPVFLEDDFFYAAFLPLNVTNRGRNEALRIEENNGFLAINLINYEGPAKHFSRRDLLLTENGFVAEVGGKTDSGNFEAFRQSIVGGVISDVMRSDQRTVTYKRGGVALSLSHSPIYDGLKFACIDNQPLPRDKFVTTPRSAS